MRGSYATRCSLLPLYSNFYHIRSVLHWWLHCVDSSAHQQQTDGRVSLTALRLQIPFLHADSFEMNHSTVEQTFPNVDKAASSDGFVGPAVPETPASSAPVVVIKPTKGWRAIDLRELWRYRDLIYFLTLRDIKARYKQTILGVFWAVFQPLMTTGIFALLFGLLLGRGNEPTVAGVPYVVSTFCAMLPWQLFAHSVGRGGTCLVAAQGMITKVYFPRVILPLSAVFGGLVDFSLAFGILILLMLFYGVVPSAAVLTVPLFLALTVVASLSISLWLAGLSALYRDFQHVVPFVVRAGMWISPVVYTTSSITAKLPDWAVLVYSLNPMAGVIEGFRWALLGKAAPPGFPLVLSVLMTVVLFWGAMLFFRRIEGNVIDVV